MFLSQFHFEQDAWLWGLLAIPAVLLVHALLHRAAATKLLERFADQHLLPHLVKSRGRSGIRGRNALLLWSLAWLCCVLAMAGPRWDYTDEPTFRTAQYLVIVLDLSQTMNAQDVKPSRMVRALEKIEDILDMSQGTSIGLVAYAAVPHMVTPLTDDVRTIRNLLPALNTSLVMFQGDRLGPALEMAANMLKAEPGNDKSILVISDGGFAEDNFAELTRAAGGIAIDVMGVGTATGALVPAGDGGWLQDASGKAQVSRLRADRLQLLATAGKGLYVEANYTDSDTLAILGRVEAPNNAAQSGGKSVRVWQERFYIPALILALLLLPLFRKGANLAAIMLLAAMALPAVDAHAAALADIFLNQDQQAEAAYRAGNYKDALAKFDTPYRRGVTAYRAGAYDKAAVLFKEAFGQNGDLDALYNLGNAQLMQYQPQDAIDSYKAVLKQRPTDASALHNLAIAEKMLAQNQQQKPDNKQDQDKQNKPPDQQQDKNGQGNNQDKNGGGQNQSQQDKNGQGNTKNQNGGGQNQPQQGKNGQANTKNQNAGGQNQPQQNKNAQTDNQNQNNQNQKGGTQNPPQSQRPQPPQQAGQQKAAQPQGGTQAASASPPQRAPGNAGSAAPAGSTGQGRPEGVAYGAVKRTQQDVKADEWLGRVQTDPGSFLRNQFVIEDYESSASKKTTQ